MKKVLLGLLSITLIAGACKKSDSPPPPITKENLTGAYKIVADVSTSAEGVSHDAFADYSPCTKDDVYNFNSDNTLVVNDAGVVCDPAGSWSDSWSLEGTTITIAGLSGTVSKFDGSNMEVTFQFGDGSKDKVTFKK